MATVPPSLIEITSRHQLHLEGVKTGIARKFDPFLIQMSKDIERRLLKVDITEYNARRLEKLKALVEEDMQDSYGKYYDIWREQIIDLSNYESVFEVRSLEQVIETHDFALPSRTQLRAAVFGKPFVSLTGPGKGLLLETFYQNWTVKGINSVAGEITNGFYQGKTTPQIVRAIKGTGALKWQDGILSKEINRELTSVVRTAVQHAAMEARNETWNVNSDIITGWVFVATIDKRTSAECASFDGQVFPLNEGPFPPLHVQCRSTTAAQIDERFSILESTATRSTRNEKGVVEKDVSAKKTFYEILKTRSQAYQDEFLGVNRAKLFRDGGISAKRFSELNYDKLLYKERTLAEMRELEPLAFEKAGVTYGEN